MRWSLLLALFVSLPAQAQIAGGGGGERPVRSASSAPAVTFSNYTYLQGGTASPAGSYGTPSRSGADLEQAYATGRSADGGYYLEAGGARFLWTAPGVPVAVGLGWAASGTLYTVDNAQFYDADESAVSADSPEGTADVRLGGVVAYQPVSGLTLELSVTAGPGIGVLQEVGIDDARGFRFDGSDADSEGFAVGTFVASGVSVSYSGLTVGAARHGGDLSFERSLSGNAQTETYTADVSMAATRLFLGLRL